MSAGISRRNGKQASCEPCRKGKLRCDHQRPICERCRRRGLETRCWYHPAPLTRQRIPSPKDDADTVSLFSGLHSSNASYGTSLVGSNSDKNSNRAQATAGGSGGQTLALPLQPLNGLLDAASNHDQQVRFVVGLLAHLRDLKLIQRCLDEYYALAQVALVPGPLILPAISALRSSSYLLEDTEGTERNISHLAEDVLRCTTAKIYVTPSLKAADFAAMYTGENLRIDTVGLICAIAARSCLLGLTRISRDDEKRNVFARGMLRCSTDCLRLAREVAPFASCYRLDKYIASLYDRPLRISQRHSDCRMPLDLGDEQICADPVPEQEQLGLTIDGWSKDGKHTRSTWIRLLYILGGFREETQEFFYCPLTTDNRVKLEDVSRRCHKACEALPAHLRYTPACWDSNPSWSILSILHLTIIHLIYLQIDFQVYRLLGKEDPIPSRMLLKVSAETLDTVLHFGKSRDRAVFLREDFSLMVRNYGLPAAALLAKTLQNTAGRILPIGLSHSSLIRSLSVFISHLESICTAGDPNHPICVQASKTLSRTLDDVLDSSTIPPFAASPADAVGDAENATYATPPSQTQPLLLGTGGAAMADSTSMDISTLDGLDLFDWAANIDWTNSVGGGQWSTF